MPSTQSGAIRILGGELTERAKAQLRQLELELYGSEGRANPRVLRAILACRLGARVEEVAKNLDWKEFESFCAELLRTRGFSVKENVVLGRPRVQVDLLARSDLVALAIDCKHWKRSMGSSSLSRCVRAQKRRARLLREQDRDVKPIATVILLLADEQARFVGGGAVVPVRTLGSFLDEVAGHTKMLDYD